jgi:hypothetical protein
VAGTDDGAAVQFGLGDAAARFVSAGVGRDSIGLRNRRQRANAKNAGKDAGIAG